MAKAKPAAKDIGQDQGAKSTRKPRAKKVPLLAIDGDANHEPMVTRNQEYAPTKQTEPSAKTPNTSNAQSLTSTEGQEQREGTRTDTEESKSQEQDSDQQAPQSDQSTGKEGKGDVALIVAESPTTYEVSLMDSMTPTRARAGETRSVCWERARREGRAAGLPRGQGPGTAYEWANLEVDRLFPAQLPPEPVIVEEPEPIPEPVAVDPEPDLSTIVDTLEPTPTPIASDQGVPGLGTLPESWGILPANASLQVEISWVSANRLRVRDGSGVDLSKALSPAPSYSALSWLETSILFPSKFADISVKATANQDDEKEAIRREKLAIEDIRGLLAEMLED